MDISSFARCAAYAAFGFACGGVMFCRFMPLMLAKKDITKLSSDGNPGSANVFINCGIPLGLLCLFLDMFKGFLPVLLAEENYDVRRLSFAILIAAPVRSVMRLLRSTVQRAANALQQLSASCLR